MINDLLSQFGLNDKEIQIYLSVLQSGPVSATQISRLTKIKRTTVYTVIKQLETQGFLNEDIGHTPSLFFATKPDDLQAIIQRRERDLEAQKMLVSQMITELKPLTKEASVPIPRIRYIEEAQIEDYLYKQFPVWDESTAKSTDKTVWGFQDKQFADKFKQYIEKHNAPRLQKQISIKLISDAKYHQTEVAKKNYSLLEIKFWERWQEFTATTWVRGDYVIMIVLNEHPNYLVEIHDKTLAHNMRELFKGIWEKI